ncbi:hypothetical protein P6N53_18115 [Desulforamulus aquiferis]|uniref:Uncharacterized protein n=2 Tax=Desulforamulus aquiferis TaxID=1397668 RepID=A0AAW7ZJF7_9FIRM|nr:hypothetical protein [Desulforamulus aquiferis]
MKAGDIVEHSWQRLGPCEVVAKGETLLGWPVVFIRDAAGVVHEVNPIYLTKVSHCTDGGRVETSGTHSGAISPPLWESPERMGGKND